MKVNPNDFRVHRKMSCGCSVGGNEEVLREPMYYGPAAAKKGVREIIIDADCVNGVGSAKVAGSIDMR